jgi:hypothetical protein
MSSFSQLPSGKWRVQVRRAGIYKAGTFPTKREARDWANQIESHAQSVATNGVAPPPKSATVADLIDKYTDMHAKTPGRTKAATLEMLKREIGQVKLTALSSGVLRDFIDRRAKAGAGGVTIAGDLSFFSAVLSWGRHARQLDLPERLALDARSSLKHRGLNTRSKERDREPTDDELSRLFHYWQSNLRQKIDMVTLCRMALARKSPNGAAAAGRLAHRRARLERAGDRLPVPDQCRIGISRFHSGLHRTRDSRLAFPRFETQGNRPVLSDGPGHPSCRIDDGTQDLGHVAAIHGHQADGCP